MEKLHMTQQYYDGYCVGQGVEYPGIIVSAKSDKELKKMFINALPGHKELLDKNPDTVKTSVVEIVTN